MLKRSPKLLALLAPALMVMLSSCARPTTDAPDAGTAVYAVGDSLSVVGTLVDTRCFALNKNNTTNDHELPDGHVTACGTACAMQGIPVAVLEGGSASGKPWILVSYPSQIFAEYVSKTVRVTGSYGADGIIVPEHVDLETEDGWARIL